MVSRHQIKKAIKVLELACAEDFADVKNELTTALASAKQQIENSDKAYKMISRDMGKAQAMYNFDDNFFANLKIDHPTIVKKFIQNWISKQTDWRYPIVFINAADAQYTYLGVKSLLTYVLSRKFTPKKSLEIILSKLSEQATPKQFRYKSFEHHGRITNMVVPHKQIGCIVCLDYFPYLSIEQINNFIESFNNLLRPGGQAFIHFVDADGDEEWKGVVDKKYMYCTQEILQKICDSFGLTIEFYNVKDCYSFASIKKPGMLTSNKKGPTKMQKIV